MKSKINKSNNSKFKSLAITMEMWGLPERVVMSELPEDIFILPIQKNYGSQLVFFTDWQIVIEPSYGDFDVVRNYLIERINSFDRSFTLDGITYELFYEIAEDNERDLYPQLNLTARGSFDPLVSEDELTTLNKNITEMTNDLDSLYQEQSLENEYFFINIA